MGQLFKSTQHPANPKRLIYVPKWKLLMLNALENLMMFKAVSYHEQSRSLRIKQKAWVTLFFLKQKSQFKNGANIHILLIYRLPKSSDFLGAEVLIAVKMKVQDLLLWET